VWSAAFVTILGLPLIAALVEIPTAVASGAATASVETEVRPWLSLDARWSLVIATLWAVATMVRACGLVVHAFRLRKIWRDAIPVQIEGRLHDLLASATEGWNRGPLEVCTTSVLQRPSVIGFMKPRILIPDWLFARLTAGELEQIVLHEAEHLRRRDDWTNLLQKVCLVVFPLNLALLWIERRLCREREMACDDGVIRITHAPRSYAACLASLAERGLERRAEALSLGAWHRRSELVHRVHSILRNRGGMSPLGTRALLGTLGCGLLVGSVELARCPQLVAFVPARSIRAAQPLDGPYAPTDLAAGDGKSAMMKLAAIKSSSAPNRKLKSVAASASMRPAAMAQNVAQGWSAAQNDAAKRSSRAVMLKAELPDARGHEEQARRAEQNAGPQWIVLTAWEQIQTSNPSAALKAVYDASAHGDANTQPSTQLTSRVTVTRLILRVIPASLNSGSSKLGVAAVRDGWLVIQL
jgi:beta-lactamase regulating signal transducer with metallopeptidase domain